MKTCSKYNKVVSSDSYALNSVENVCSSSAGQSELNQDVNTYDAELVVTCPSLFPRACFYTNGRAVQWLYDRTRWYQLRHLVSTSQPRHGRLNGSCFTDLAAAAVLRLVGDAETRVQTLNQSLQQLVCGRD